MSELQKRLGKLDFQLCQMGLLVMHAVDDALRAIAELDVQAGEELTQKDTQIDRAEVEIEQECINLLALYQPAAIDLRRICGIIKINSDLERMADIAARLGRRVKHIAAAPMRLGADAGYNTMVAALRDILSMTLKMLGSSDQELARQVIAADRALDAAYAAFTRNVVDAGRRAMDVDTVLTLVLLARSIERIGDHCTNIAEDVLFLITGEIMRHSPSLKEANPQQ